MNKIQIVSVLLLTLLCSCGADKSNKAAKPTTPFEPITEAQKFDPSCPKISFADTKSPEVLLEDFLGIEGERAFLIKAQMWTQFREGYHPNRTIRSIVTAKLSKNHNGMDPDMTSEASCLYTKEATDSNINSTIKAPLSIALKTGSIPKMLELESELYAPQVGRPNELKERFISPTSESLKALKKAIIDDGGSFTIHQLSSKMYELRFTTEEENYRNRDKYTIESRLQYWIN